MKTNEVRDAIIDAAPEHAGTVLSRDQIVENWCRVHGKEKDRLSIDDILLIRALPEWRNAG